jgi:predicted dehydrogenase
LQPVAVEQPPLDDAGEARVFPVSRLVRRFLDACERGGTPSPGFAEGFRSQQLLDAVRRSHADGRWIAVASESASVEVRP